jgi:hypothetical protein
MKKIKKFNCVIFSKYSLIKRPDGVFIKFSNRALSLVATSLIIIIKRLFNLHFSYALEKKLVMATTLQCNSKGLVRFKFKLFVYFFNLNNLYIYIYIYIYVLLPF